MIALTATTLFTPLERIEQPLLLMDGARFVEVTSRVSREAPGNCRLVDFGDAVLAPGFIDMHIHGAAGRDVMEAAPDALPAIEQLLARHGVAGYFPTTVTASMDATLAALDRLAVAIDAAMTEPGNGLRARPLGIHLEGPFISHARRGVHPAGHLLPPTITAFERLWQAARGHIRVMTIAPELDGAMEIIAAAARRGVLVSLGHSDADRDTTRAAIAAGARHATHTFNAMRPLRHRDPGIVGEVLTNPQLTADIIADGIHVDPIVTRLFVQSKGLDSAVLISDATAATGMPDGRYRLGSLEIEMKDGKCVADGKLAGSVLTMDTAVRNIVSFTQASLQDALRLATVNPARVTGLHGRGRIEPGAVADLFPGGDHRLDGSLVEPFRRRAAGRARPEVQGVENGWIYPRHSVLLCCGVFRFY